MAPATLGFVASIAQEFPFAGDSAFHISVHYRTALFWISPIASPVDAPGPFALPGLSVWSLLKTRAIDFFAVVAIVGLLLRLGFPRAALAVAATLAGVWAIVDSWPFQRYPGLVYFLGVPFNLAVGAVLPFETTLGPRFVSFLALPCWLFLLRPWIVGRVPDLRGTVTAIFLFWAERQIYWQSAPYLESWAICFLLLGLESVVERDRDGAAIGCLCVGLAACAKEQAILFLPFVWLAGKPWRRTAAPDWTQADWIVVGAAASLPFLFHLGLRTGAGGARNLGAGGIEIGAVVAGASDFLVGIARYYGDGFYLPLIVALIGAFAGLANAKRRGGLLACLGGSIAILFLHGLDSAGSDGSFAGYYRFAEPLLPALALCAGVAIESLGDRRRGAIALGIWTSIHLPGAVAGVRTMAGPSELRSGFEDGNGALFVPVRNLMNSASVAGVLDRSTPIDLATPTPFIASHPAARRGYDLRFVDAIGFSCVCNAERPAAMAVYLRRNPAAGPFAGVRRVTEIPVAPGTRAEPGEIPAAFPACRASLEATCRYVAVRDVDGQPLGILGVGPR